MAISRQKKVYLPTTTRKNQYITVGFPLTDEFIAHYEKLENCYQEFSKLVFQTADKFELYNVHVVATDKLPVVRFHNEVYCFSTQEQLRFFYNPVHHEANRLHMIPDYRAKKLKVVFLATGDEIRSKAANFHARIREFTEALMPQLPTQKLATKIRDHQHISYDLFAKNKGHKETYGYKLRALNSRYQHRDCPLPEDVSALSYVQITMPVGRRIKNQLLAENRNDFSDSYQKVCQKFIDAARSKQLNKLAVVANGKVPLVRNSKFEDLQSTAEFQMIGFDPSATDAEPICHWDGNVITEAIRFVIVAGDSDIADGGYGRFMNQVEDAMRKFISDIDFDKEHIDLTVGFHQHLSYKA
ncbi:DUF3083 family protein [Shewanella sp. 10N.286.52.B9]|uniref:DUF3083 family protein n=1 Tax=Shewanella sp. 10N.286.52.B9 TaxID=1880837 RepID=UPI000C8548E7|nr:DUF3083 family protein [Shewanella sp. 10N.286.52.B9]PMG41290.1 hypothetical protein BCU91_10815 [Shewanella sp. 10N.286.52.B9]